MSDILKKLINWLEENEAIVSTGLGVVVVGVIGWFVLGSYRNGAKVVVEPDLSEVSESLGGEANKYVIQPGESLSMIAERVYGNKDLWQEIAKANGITNPNLVEPGMEIVLPDVGIGAGGAQKPSVSPTPAAAVKTPGSYTVKPGDYLARIALEVYGDGSKWMRILEANRERIKNPDKLEAGTVLIIPQ